MYGLSSLTACCRIKCIQDQILQFGDKMKTCTGLIDDLLAFKSAHIEERDVLTRRVQKSEASVQALLEEHQAAIAKINSLHAVELDTLETDRNCLSIRCKQLEENLGTFSAEKTELSKVLEAQNVRLQNEIQDLKETQETQTKTLDAQYAQKMKELEQQLDENACLAEVRHQNLASISRILCCNDVASLIQA